ncbi:MAG: transposase [Oscillospiraceae bacterium]|nr:transposase [Oscillospiraceae bacterium]
MELPSRKRIRLAEYDYSTSGVYFITVCTRDRAPLFWNVASLAAVGAAISRPPSAVPVPYHLTAHGKTVEQAILNISEHYVGAFVDKFAIMPDHIHLLLRIENSGRLIAAPTVNTVIGQMKRWASKQAGFSLWQKSYYEHVIRNDADYEEACAYIEGNPARWLEKHGFSEQ